MRNGRRVQKYTEKMKIIENYAQIEKNVPNIMLKLKKKRKFAQDCVLIVV